ncbi:MAG TPA: hypothetical protein VF524_06355 [Polyangia bacterium]
MSDTRHAVQARPANLRDEVLAEHAVHGFSGGAMKTRACAPGKFWKA